MKLTYTIEIDLGEQILGKGPVQYLIDPEDVSAELMRCAFERVGKRVAGRRIDYLTIWPHENSRPTEPLPGDDPEEVRRPAETCETCGVPSFEKARA